VIFLSASLTFRKGLVDGLPIGLGYLAVSFAFGMMAADNGLSVLQSVLISAVNMTSAGQFAGLTVITTGAPYIEMVLTQLVINMRYALMSLSLSQKLDERIGTGGRMAIAFANTDEIFAVASSQTQAVPRLYMHGLALLPFFGWTGGTLLGAVAAGLLPPLLCDSLSLALYAMFIAIVLPPAKENRAIRPVVALALLLSCAFTWLPGLKNISSGFAIIICTIIAAAAGALLHPVGREENGNE